MKLDFDILGDKKAEQAITDVGERAQNLRPAFEQIATLLQAGLRRQFESQGSYLGRSWPRLAEETLERKARQGQPQQILVATGALRNSLTGGGLRRITKTMVRVGTKNFTARFAQGGTSRGEPARPLVGIAEHDRERALDVIHAHLIR